MTTSILSKVFRDLVWLDYSICFSISFLKVVKSSYTTSSLYNRVGGGRLTETGKSHVKNIFLGAFFYYV